MLAAATIIMTKRIEMKWLALSEGKSTQDTTLKRGRVLKQRGTRTIFVFGEPCQEQVLFTTRD